MKTYKETADEVFRIGNMRIKSKKKKRKIMISALSVIIVTTAVVGLWQNNAFKAEKLMEEREKLESEHNSLSSIKVKPTTEIDSSVNEVSKTAENNTKKHTESPTGEPRSQKGGTDGTVSGGTYGGDIGISVTGINAFKETGEAITDEEAQEYFRKNFGSIASSLFESGVAADSLRISEKGYCHANYDESTGGVFEVRQNFRDYLAYNGDELVSIITLVKENGEIYSSPAFGGPWFGDYNRFLQSHKGKKLLYFYIGQAEVIVTPGNEVVNPLGLECTGMFKGYDSVYESLDKCETIVFVP